ALALRVGLPDGVAPGEPDSHWHNCGFCRGGFREKFVQPCANDAKRRGGTLGKRWRDPQSPSAGCRRSPTGTRVAVTAASRTASGLTMTAWSGESSAASTTTASANAADTDGWSGYLLLRNQPQRAQLVRREWSSAPDTAPSQRKHPNANEQCCHHCERT